MNGLPRIFGRDAVAALFRAGFVFNLQHGSHIVLRRDQPFAQVVVPDHEEAPAHGSALFPYSAQV